MTANTCMSCMRTKQVSNSKTKLARTSSSPSWVEACLKHHFQGTSNPARVEVSRVRGTTPKSLCTPSNPARAEGVAGFKNGSCSILSSNPARMEDPNLSQTHEPEDHARNLIETWITQNIAHMVMLNHTIELDVMIAVVKEAQEQRKHGSLSHESKANIASLVIDCSHSAVN